MRRIAQLNIDHFNKLLTTEADPTKREMIMRLLAEEAVKLEHIGAEKPPHCQKCSEYSGCGIVKGEQLYTDSFA
jgi:hypothetical protein